MHAVTSTYNCPDAPALLQPSRRLSAAPPGWRRRAAGLTLSSRSPAFPHLMLRHRRPPPHMRLLWGRLPSRAQARVAGAEGAAGGAGRPRRGRMHGRAKQVGCALPHATTAEPNSSATASHMPVSYCVVAVARLEQQAFRSWRQVRGYSSCLPPRAGPDRGCRGRHRKGWRAGGRWPLQQAAQRSAARHKARLATDRPDGGGGGGGVPPPPAPSY